MEISIGNIILMGRMTPFDPFKVQGVFKNIDSAKEDLANPLLLEGDYVLLQVVELVPISAEMVDNVLVGKKLPTFRELLETYKEEILSEIRSSKGQKVDEG